jgi:NAD(P)H-hydrate epimerase
MMTFASQPTDDDHLVTGYLNAKDASDLDAELMASPGFTLEQLMELAGLSVAQAVYEVTPPTKQKILLVCGPGNNGGDGLVAARHLNLFGHDSVIVYPKRSSKQPHYANLIKTCEDLGIPILDSMPEDLSSFATIVDAIFGFSFVGTPRAPFDHIIQQMMDAQRHYKIPIVAVDVPSGWNVDEGDVAGLGFQPQVLVSLTAPKLCAKKFKGRHFCGGRFLPPILADKYGITMPPYPGTAQIMELTTSDSCVEQEKNYE